MPVLTYRPQDPGERQLCSSTPEHAAATTSLNVPFSAVGPLVSSLTTFVTPDISETPANSGERSEAPSSSALPISSSGGSRILGSASVSTLILAAGINTDDIHSFFGLNTSDQLPERIFAVEPLSWCQHLTATRPPLVNWIPDIRNSQCGECDNRSENWVCLTCYQVFCGRFARGHMLRHHSTTSHPMAMSYSDLSAWCYDCDAYVHNEASHFFGSLSHILPNFNLVSNILNCVGVLRHQAPQI
ncbi:unnamed protein product [Protopolystoma xenopodis]|uniref:UBP-type domain-containing protein n=1 Tax=Protopolystoma xenopodis TaxID=117903 RepID=A0A448XD43_9PLAT|nr:unnamed protein product [Protopolystoma xenopodis]